jgi:hypothetical protein
MKIRKKIRKEIKNLLKEFKVTGDYNLDDMGIDLDFEQEMQEKESNQIELWFYAVASMPADYTSILTPNPDPYELNCYYFKTKEAFEESFKVDELGRCWPNYHVLHGTGLPGIAKNVYRPFSGVGPVPVVAKDHYKYHSYAGLHSDEELLKMEFCKGNIDTILVHNHSGPGHKVIQKGPYFNQMREEQTPTYYLYFKEKPDDVIITCK